MFLILVLLSAVAQASSVNVPLPGAVGSVPKTVSFNAGTSFKHIDEVRLRCNGSITYGLGCGDGVERPVFPYFAWPAKVEADMDPPGTGIWVAEFGSGEGPFNQEKAFEDIIPTTWDFLLDGQADLYIYKSSVVVIGGIMLTPPSASISQATLIIKGTVIDILSPSLGETLTGGSMYTINWQDYRNESSCPYTYFLDYSIDGGQHWLAIDSNAVAGSCSYDWTVPDVNSQQCIIRITDTNDPNFTDTTAGYFTIHRCPTDLNRDAFVDFVDYAVLSLNWQQSPDPCNPNSGDIIKNGIVDIYDLAELCDDWLACYVTQAAAPEPADHAVNVSRNAILQWSPGDNVASHDVYFGTDFNAVDTADTTSTGVYMGNQDANYWDSNNYANQLDTNTTYYWRIDENGPVCGAKGDVWSFTTCLESDINYGLADWWKFDEANGTTAYDSASSNNGTIYGTVSWTTGKIAGALSFNGSTNYVNCGNGASNYDNVTVSAWMKTSTDGVLASNRDNGGSYGTWYTLLSTRIEIGDNSQGGYRSVTFITPTLNGLWHHVVYTKNGTSHAIYVDGSLDQSFTSNADISQNSPLFIGKRWTRSESVGWFNGVIDDVRIYNRVLSADEVALLYQQGQ